MDNDELTITYLDRPLPSVAERRALRGQPLPTDTSLRVSGLRFDAVNGRHVVITGEGIMSAQLALTHIEHPWLDMHGLTLGVDMLAGPDYRASAEAAKVFYEGFVYDPATDMENAECGVILTDENSWWVLGGGE